MVGRFCPDKSSLVDRKDTVEIVEVEEVPVVIEFVFEPGDEPAFRKEGKSFIPRIRPPSNTLGFLLEGLDECVPNRFGCPLALGKEDPVVSRRETDDIDLILAVPPSADLGVGGEVFSTDCCPDSFLADVFERCRDVIGEVRLNRPIEDDVWGFFDA